MDSNLRSRKTSGDGERGGKYLRRAQHAVPYEATFTADDLSTRLDDVSSQIAALGYD